MLKPSDFNNAVPKFQNGTYANNPLDPTDVAEPTMEDYVRGVEPLDTLPAQWWNWLCNQFTSRFNKINTYVKNVFDELTQLLSLVGVTPDGTEGTITTGQLKNAFEQRYPNFLSKFIHTIAQIWSYTGSSTSGSVTTTQASRLAVFEKVTASDSSTSPATVTETYNTKYVDTLPVRLGGTGANTKQGALANLTCELTTPEVLPQDADVIINNNGVVQKTSVSSIVSYAGTVSIENSTANCAIPVALCTGFTNVGKSNCCPLTYNPATGALTASSSIGLGSGAIQDIICKLTTMPTYCQWLLLHDITDWYNSSSNVPTQSMTGSFHFSRTTGFSANVILDAVMAHAYGRNSETLQCNIGRQRFLYNILPGAEVVEDVKPVIICENATGKVYTAIRKTMWLDLDVYFSGLNQGNIINCVVPGGGQDVTIPSGWTHLYEAPLGGMVSCAETATCACNFRTACLSMSNCCWIKVGTVSNVTTGSSLDLTITRDYSSISPEVKKLNISFGGSGTNLSPKVTEDSCSSASTPALSCIVFGKANGSVCPVDIYIKTAHSGSERYVTSYRFTGNSTFTPSFTCISDACVSACACKCGIALHANGHYINSCQFDTACANTACVCASCCISTSCVTALDPGSTASKVCNLTLQAFCTNASCVKSTQQIVFNGDTGCICWDIAKGCTFEKCIKTECYGIMPNNIRMNNGGLMSYISVMAFCTACAVCAFRAGLSCFTNFGVIGTMILDGDLCPISFITCNSNVFSFYKPTSTSPFKTLCATATSTLSANCISTLHLMSLR